MLSQVASGFIKRSGHTVEIRRDGVTVAEVKCLPFENEGYLAFLPGTDVRAGDEIYFKVSTKLHTAQEVELDVIDDKVSHVKVYPVPSSMRSQRSHAHAPSLTVNGQYIGGNVDNRGGTFVHARDISHSFNEIGKKAAKEKVAERLEQLAISLNKILATLPDDVAEKVTRDAKSFAEEAAGKEPDKESLETYWELLQKGLKKTAEASIPVLAPLIASVIKAAIG
ncbi:hypothetical protein R5W24_005226 [Gemmata sp. JC717]|uniref:hypothetical protein n=1 Tax=Gemmata algarum TaxID=2975278 RepID=UPI0021BBB24A|nr:hypothetical protein [Gemmata algarum]MDY3556063.1 hypothetical protein [Gemmata algarum]